MSFMGLNMSGLDVKCKWVCPNDRELTLRAKLDAGWSVKSHTNTTSSCPNSISENEQEVILSVLRRAQQSDKQERERINRLVDRVNNMKRNAKGDGRRCCALCNDQFGLFGNQGHFCKDCQKSVCNKCGLDTFTPEKEPLYLCKICSETREMWKKSGAWFFKGIPKVCLYPDIKLKSELSPSTAVAELAEHRSSSTSLLSSPSSVSPSSGSPVMRRKVRSTSPREFRNAIISSDADEISTPEKLTPEQRMPNAIRRPNNFGNSVLSHHYKH